MCIKIIKNMQFNDYIFKICNNVYFTEKDCNIKLQSIL